MEVLVSGDTGTICPRLETVSEGKTEVPHLTSEVTRGGTGESNKRN